MVSLRAGCLRIQQKRQRTEDMEMGALSCLYKLVLLVHLER